MKKKSKQSTIPSTSKLVSSISNIKKSDSELMNLSEIDLNLLKVFEALFIEQNVTKAASRLSIAQSSLSSSLKRLRVLFSDELFVRSPSGMLPTKRAIEIEENISKCLLHARQAITVPGGFDPLSSDRTFIIGGSDFSAFTILPSLIAFLKKEAPHIRLEMRPFLPDETLQQIDNGAIDFAVSAGDDIPRRLYSKKLFDEDMVVITRRNHPAFKGKDKLTLKKYASLQHIFVTSKGEGEKIIDKELKKNSLARDIYLKVQNFLVVPYIVENSDLIATLSERVAYQCSQRTKLEIIPLPIKVARNSFNIIWGKASNLDHECLWLIENIHRLIKESGKPQA